MQILDIVLAFALLLVVFASIASAITELVLRAIRLKSRTLQSSISLFARDVIWPAYADLMVDRLPRGEQREIEKDRTIRELVHELTRNPTVETVADARQRSPFLALFGTLGLRLFSGVASVDKLSTEAFVQRFADTPSGAVFAGEAARLKTLTLAFERYMATSQERYRKRASIAAILVSIVFAGAANIQFGALVNHLRENPTAVESIIADGDEIVRRSNIAAEQSDAEDFKKSVEELSAQLKAVRDDYQLPIGWSTSNEDTAGAEWAAILWLLNVLISGLLIGLGAPFWYAVIKNIGQVRAVAGAISREDREMIAAHESTTDPLSTLERHQANVDLFNAAARSQKPTFVDDDPPPVG